MDLTTLTRDELNELFMKINDEYTRVVRGDVKDYANDVEFLKVRSELRNVLNELERRHQKK